MARPPSLRRPPANFQRKRRNQADYLQRKKLYDSAHWKRLRAMIIAERIFCEACKIRGRLVPGTQVDHRVDLAKGGAPFEEENLSLLCASCHSTKTHGGNLLKGCDENGMPFAGWGKR